MSFHFLMKIEFPELNISVLVSKDSTNTVNRKEIQGVRDLRVQARELFEWSSLICSLFSHFSGLRPLLGSTILNRHQLAGSFSGCG